MTDHEDSLTESKLCRNCSVLSFNDAEIGGVELRMPEGECVLGFAEGLPLPQEGKRKVRLEYNMSDMLPHLQNLQRSSQAGCNFCGALRDSTQERGWTGSAEIKFDLWYVWSAVEPSAACGLQVLLVDLQIRSRTTDNFKHEDTLLFQIDCTQEKCMSWLGTKASPRKYPICSQNISWIKQEFDRCAEHGCLAASSDFVPARLVDVGTNDRDCLRLVNTSHTPTSNLQYATLSYCWGNAQEAKHQLRTTSINFEQHSTTIAFSQLTRLVQDSVAVARALSIRYLWIDALCIVQDDVHDWTLESGRMDQIYANSHVTICVPTASSCLEGFLSRPKPIAIPFVSKIRPDVCGTLSLRYQAVKDDTGFPESADLHPVYLDIARGGPWSTRAWTYQEEQLSMRRIYFGRSNIHFDCGNRAISEPGNGDVSRHFNCVRESIVECRESQDAASFYDLWDDVIHGYVHRSATNIMDMFPALSGLARTMANEIDDTYVAGLWMNDLPRGLLWSSSDADKDWLQFSKQMTLNREKDYIGPSWSWASFYYHDYEYPDFSAGAATGGAVTSGSHERLETHFRSECQDLTAWTIPHSPKLNAFGRIKHGEMHVLAKIRASPLEWTRHRPLRPLFKRWIARLDDLTVACAIDFAVADSHPSFVVQNAYMLLLASSHGNTPKWSDKTCGINADHSTTYATTSAQDAQATGSDAEFSSLLGTSGPDRGELPERNAWGLLVHPTSGYNEYFRFGVFRIASRDGGLLHFEQQPYTFVKVI
ncbi:heterokaryon incompatibility protein-domain-containing protein [Phaeosphaeria sp. MPI-PUGE-AT-0046c]|nr:heterokaryon incompatibility protein-domain-containing protein [Phaeosphaeria sp. MPI-PUGE-AT-0046c]